MSKIAAMPVLTSLTANKSNCAMTSKCVRTDSTLPPRVGRKHGRSLRTETKLSFRAFRAEKLFSTAR